MTAASITRDQALTPSSTPKGRGVPAVSVLIPVHNGCPFFRAAVDSVLTQSFQDFECLIMDDGSTDETGKIADELARLDSRVRVFHREKRGLVSSLNELINAARGEFVARMDADDLCMPTRFARQVDFMRQYPDVVCVGSCYWMIDEAGRTITQIRTPLADADIQQQALRGHSVISHPSAMMRTDMLRGVGGYRAAYFPAEDLDLWLRLGEVGTLANLPDPLIRYRVHAASISALAAQGRQREAARRACADAWERRHVPDGQFEATREWRADDTALSRMRFALQYGWMAYTAGFRQTAMVYGLKAIRLLPTRQDGWRLFAVALLRPRKKSVVG